MKPGTNAWTRAHNNYLEPPEEAEIPEEYYTWGEFDPEVGMPVTFRFPKWHVFFEKEGQEIFYVGKNFVGVRGIRDESFLIDITDFYEFVEPDDDLVYERWMADHD